MNFYLQEKNEQTDSLWKLLQNGIQEIKNSQDEWVGIGLNGLLFTRFGSLMADEYVESLRKNYDMILPFEYKVQRDSVEELLTELLPQEWSKGLEENLKEMGEEYHRAYQFVLKHQRLYFPGTFISSRQTACSCLDWMNSVCDRWDKNFLSDVKNEECLQLLLGILQKIWLTTHPLRIKEETIEKYDPEKMQVRQQRTQLVCRYMNIVEEPLVSAYQRGKKSFLTIPSIIGNQYPSNENQQPVDADRIPVWICWWQGEQQMPALVKACVDSIRQNLPENACLHIITLENYLSYATLTPEILQKFEASKISYTHLAEALRAELLYRYGGLWIDATYFVSGRIPAWVWERDFYTIAFEYPIFGEDVSMARWSTSLLYFKEPRTAFARFLVEEIWNYWEKQDSLVDYFIMDYEVALAYENLAEARKMIDSCPKANANVYNLQLRMNQRFTEKAKKAIGKDSVFYKLNRRLEYVEKTAEGDTTIYGAMLCGQFFTDTMLESQSPAPYHELHVKQQEVMNILREQNPSRILDMAHYFERMGSLSHGALPEILFSLECVDLYEGEEKTEKERTEWDRLLYDHIITKSAVLRYDLILLPEDVISRQKKEEICRNFLENANGSSLLFISF